MSKLAELIQELCPNGVEYRTLGDCVHEISNIKWTTVDEQYLYIDLTSVDRNTHKIAETQAIDANSAPSRAQQREIVRILDNFTELTARKKQYEHYRDLLLTFGSADRTISEDRQG